MPPPHLTLAKPKSGSLKLIAHAHLLLVRVTNKR